jgi:magnesium transporter
LTKNTFIEFNIAEHTAKEVTLENITLNERSDIIYWVHCDLNDTQSFKKIIQLLDLPDHVVALCDAENKLPVFIDDDDMVTLRIEAPLSTELLPQNFALENLIIHLSQQFCFTATTVSQPAIEDFYKHYSRFTRHAKTPCFILFLILDNAVNDYAKLLLNYEWFNDELDAKVETVEENIYQKVMDTKQEIMKIKRNVTSIREILMRISGRNISVISEQCGLSLRNLSHHSHLIIHEIDSIREILNDLLNQIDNALMQRLNQTMRVLTAFAAIFLPLTLITGIYGMNFKWIPELSWKYGYFYALALLVGCAVTLLFVFKKKKWF